MDLKGISWVGNMYQKFETMCMEVEETLYEDTVQYVENQARTVGACLKKFYCDVMQDMLPDSFVYPVKTETLEQGLPHCADVIVHGRLKTVAKKEPMELKQVGKFSVSSDVGNLLDEGFSSKKSTVRSLCKKSLPWDAVDDDQWPDWNWEPNESCPGFRLNSRRKSSSPERSNQTTHVAKATVLECWDSHGEDGATKIGSLDPDCTSVSEGKEVNCKETADTDGCVASIPFDSPVLNMKLDEIWTEGAELLEPPGGSLLSELDGRPSCLDEIRADDSGDAGLVVCLSLHSTNLLESCVLVDRNEHCPVSQSQGKQRSYKKKFRDAFCSSKWSKSKEHHEQPSGDLRKSSLAASMTYSQKRNSEVLDSCESEWELL